jgi:hypothetical protein
MMCSVRTWHGQHAESSNPAVRRAYEITNDACVFFVVFLGERYGNLDEFS